MGGWVDGCSVCEVWVDGWMGGWVDGWMGGRRNGWVGGFAKVDNVSLRLGGFAKVDNRFGYEKWT
jgi:hypothetical protein